MFSPFYGGIAEGVHLFPFRTEKLSPSWPMVLVHSGRVGSCHIYSKSPDLSVRTFFYAPTQTDAHSLLNGCALVTQWMRTRFMLRLFNQQLQPVLHRKATKNP